MFKIIFHILHFLGIGCFYIAEIEIIISLNEIRKDTIKGYTFSKNPIKDVQKMYRHIPYILIKSMRITKAW